MAAPPDEAMQRAAVLFAAGRFDEARIAAEAIAAAHPRHFHALHLLAVLAAKRGDYAACIDLSSRALAIAPNAEVLSNRGAALRRLDRVEEALADYERALALAPGWVAAWNNRGVALGALGRFGEALASYDRALMLDPNHAMAHFNRSLARLVTGDFARGLQDHEWRWGGSDTQPPRRNFAQPQWTGGEIGGKTILVHAEQGLGDTLHFCRYAPLIRARGASVVMEVHAPLKALLAACFPRATVVERGEPLPAFDVHIPMLSLPLALATTFATIPADVPYLHADGEWVDRWRARLGPPSRKRVGLAWSGSVAHAHDRTRSVRLAQLAPLTGLDVEFISLQTDVRAADAAELSARANVRQVLDANADFRDTAALVALVDLVITVDTSAAHLAGAMGKRCWVILPFAPDWRWLLEREDTPWYPTLRLFRQPARGDWGSVVDRVAAELPRATS